MPRLRYLYYYKHIALDTLLLTRSVKSIHEAPTFEKLICSGSCRDADAISKTKGALEMLGLSRGTVRRAKRSVASFNLREGYRVACLVTLRRKKLFGFLDYYCTFVLPSQDEHKQEKRTRNNNRDFGVDDLIDFKRLMRVFSDLDTLIGLNINLHINKHKMVLGDTFWGF